MKRLAALAVTLFPCFVFAQIDEGYTRKIKEFTTESFFLTSIVDHLPTKVGIPTPEKFLGHIIGAPNVLTYSKQAADYLRLLEKSSGRIKVISMGMSEEGRESVVAVISSEENIRNLDEFKRMNAQLGDSRRISGPAERDSLIAKTVPMYWATAGMHAPESGPPEMTLELAYRLVASEEPMFQTIRKNEIVMLTPVLDVDGRDRVVDLYRYRKENPGKPVPPLVYWGHYVAHDDNRDAITMSLQLSKQLMRTWLDFHPTVLHDLHESVPYLYISTGTGPYNPWLDPIVISEWQELAYNEIQGMTVQGVPGVWTHNYYDGWAPSYGFYVANGHNGIGRFYETFSGGGADTGIRNAGSSDRDWYRPNPPYPSVRWSIRNNVNIMQSAIVMGMYKVANEKEKFLLNYAMKAKRSCDKAKTEGPGAYVVKVTKESAPRVAELARIMRDQGIEVRQLEAASGGFEAGSLVIRMDQPYSRMADMLLDSQYYKPTDPRSYDDTGWQLGPLFNIEVTRIKDAKILDAKMSDWRNFDNDLLTPDERRRTPRIAVVHTWQDTQDEGWARVALDQLKVPYKYVSVHELRDNSRLRDKYDVILMPQAGGSAQSIVNGTPKFGEPVPWHSTKEYPNLGGPDSSNDIRGGIELEGVVHLKDFVSKGGLLVCIGNMARIPIEFGLTSGVSVVEPKDLNAPGGVYKLLAEDTTSPVFKGYGDTVGGYFNANSLPMLAVGGGGSRGGRGGGGRAGAGGGGRASGRGSASDPDVIQGRPPYTPKAKPGDTAQGGGFRNPQGPRARALFSFADRDSVLISGMIDHAEELAGKAAVVDCPLGKGHIMLFSINPFWRGQTVGSYRMFLNAAYNFEKLGG